MKLVNKNPHPFNLYKDGELVLSLDKADKPARVDTKQVKINDIIVDNVNSSLPLKVDINSTKFGEIKDLPALQDGVLYIVSRIVASASDRDDLVIPNDLVRDDDGQVIGCRALAKV